MFFQTLQQNREKDLDVFVSLITQPKAQQGLGLYLESLKKAKKTN